MHTRTHLWTGDNGRAAAAAAASLRAKAAGAPDLSPNEPMPRHDCLSDAAAAQARGLVNKSRRAEAVALWMNRLGGDALHADLVEAMVAAGLDAERAEREIVRMLATDYLGEPRAGRYRVLHVNASVPVSGDGAP